MKIQDLLFFLVFLLGLWYRRPKTSVIAGLLFLFLSFLLFKLWVFFTAERLAWYGAAFFLQAIVLFLIKGLNFKRN